MQNKTVSWCSDREQYNALTDGCLDSFLSIDKTKPIAEINKILFDILNRYNEAEKLLLPDTTPFGLLSHEEHHKQKSDVLTGLCMFQEAKECLEKAIELVKHPNYPLNREPQLKTYNESVQWLNNAFINQVASIVPGLQEKVSPWQPFIDKYGWIILIIMLTIVLIGAFQ